MQGERLSHAVGCAFAACLERKQKRDKECGVTMTFDPKNSTFTRTGSFRQTSITERIQDPQEVKSAGTNIITPPSIPSMYWVLNASAFSNPQPSGRSFQPLFLLVFFYYYFILFYRSDSFQLVWNFRWHKCASLAHLAFWVTTNASIMPQIFSHCVKMISYAYSCNKIWPCKLFPSSVIQINDKYGVLFFLWHQHSASLLFHPGRRTPLPPLSWVGAPPFLCNFHIFFSYLSIYFIISAFQFSLIIIYKLFSFSVSSWCAHGRQASEIVKCSVIKL